MSNHVAQFPGFSKRRRTLPFPYVQGKHLICVPRLSKDHRRFDRGTQEIYKFCDRSWPNIVFMFELYTGVRIHIKTMRRYLLDRSLPIHYALAFVDMLGGRITLFDLLPQLKPYVKHAIDSGEPDLCKGDCQ